MSARISLEFVLLKYFSGTEDVTRASAGELERLQADILIDAFAHELAEEIRAADFGDPYYVGTGQGQSADLIDPEVKT